MLPAVVHATGCIPVAARLSTVPHFSCSVVNRNGAFANAVFFVINDRSDLRDSSSSPFAFTFTFLALHWALHWSWWRWRWSCTARIMR